MSTTSEQQTEQHQAELMAQLTQLTCLDAPKALRCMSDQSRLYLKLVRDFYNDSQQRADELVQLYSNADWEVLRRRVHSLKTYTAYIGAYHLSKLSAEMEALLGKDQHPKSLLGSVCSELETVIEGLAPIFCEQPTTTDNNSFSVAEFKQTLETILPLLQHSDLEVEEYLPPLTQLCQGTKYTEQISKVVDAVDEIEFEQAEIIVADILNQLG